MLIDEIRACLLPRAAGRTAADVRIGLGYTAVQLDDGRCGLAYTFRDEARAGCSAVQEAGSLAGRPAAGLARWAGAPDLIASAVGLAAINALLEPPWEAVETNILELISPRADESAGMVGHFGPLVEPLRRRVRNLYVFERETAGESWLLPEREAAAILPDCQVVILSATALLNRTLDGLLENCLQAREVAILGPSTPLLAEAFAGRRVTLLSGVQVTDPPRILRVVSEGGGTRRFGPAVRKLTLRLPGGSGSR
jgi:hypothetical protein